MCVASSSASGSCLLISCSPGVFPSTVRRPSTSCSACSPGRFPCGPRPSARRRQRSWQPSPNERSPSIRRPEIQSAEDLGEGALRLPRPVGGSRRTATGPWELLKKFASSHRALLTGVAIAVAALLATSTFVAVRLHQTRVELASSFRERADRAEQDGDWSKAAAYFAAARAQHDTREARWGLAVAGERSHPADPFAARPIRFLHRRWRARGRTRHRTWAKLGPGGISGRPRAEGRYGPVPANRLSKPRLSRVDWFVSLARRLWAFSTMLRTRAIEVASLLGLPLSRRLLRPECRS